MLIYNPQEYSHAGFQHDSEFYGGLLRSLGLAGKFCTVSPCHANIDFLVSSAADVYFDIGNPALGNISAAQVDVHSMYFGSFYSKVYTTVAGAGVANYWFTSGGPLTSSPSFNNWLIAEVNTAAIDATVTQAQEYKYESIGFSLLHASGTFAVTARMEAIFNGVKITW